MTAYTFKLYRRAPGATAAKVVSREMVEAENELQAVALARELFGRVAQADDSAMLFVSGGDVVWVSERAGAQRPSRSVPPT